MTQINITCHFKKLKLLKDETAVKQVETNGMCDAYENECDTNMISIVMLSEGGQITKNHFYKKCFVSFTF